MPDAVTDPGLVLNVKMVCVGRGRKGGQKGRVGSTPRNIHVLDEEAVFLHEAISYDAQRIS